MPRIAKFGSAHKLVIPLGVLLIVFLVSTVVLAVKLKDKQQGSKLSEKKTTLRQSIRLPRNVVPKNYNLTLRPQLSTKVFDGLVNIRVNVVKPTDNIMFHASKQLNISDITVKHQNTEIARFQNVTPDDTDVVSFYLPKVISADEYIISISYSGALDKKIVGYYASTLKNGRFPPTSKFLSQLKVPYTF